MISLLLISTLDLPATSPAYLQTITPPTCSMDEEGTIAYFKTSPSAQDAEEELTFGDEAHMQFTNDAAPMSGISSVLPQGNLLERAVYYIEQLVADTYNHDEQLMSALSGSSLLTEEDSHILHFSLKQPPILHTTSHRPNRWCFYCSSLLIATVAISLYLAVSSMIVATVTAAALGAVWTMLYRYRKNRVACRWNNYSINCEELLSLLTKTLRFIQETEVLSRGYSRPSATVPVSRMELCEGSKLQCLPLRGRLFQLCRDGVLLLRAVTRRLSKSVPTIEELDGLEGYLAYRELKSLHAHMKGSKTGDNEYTHEQLSLESLRDASNLFAVQNSEFIRRLALVVGFSKVPSKVFLFENCLREVFLFVTKARGELEWSLQYQKDFLFGEPPARTSSQADESRHHQDLQPFVNEVHCLDLKLQLALQRARDLGTLLTNRYLSGSRPPEEEVLELIKQLSAIEFDLDASHEHINEGTVVLTKMISSSCDKPTNPADVDASPLISPEVSKETATSKQEDLSEEEDAVFEAYIPPDAPDDPLEEESELITDEERQRQTEAKEVPAHLLRELNSVLAVRNDAREKRKQAKRTKRLGLQQNSAQDSLKDSNPDGKVIEAMPTLIIEIPTTKGIQAVPNEVPKSILTNEVPESVLTKFNDEVTETVSKEALLGPANFKMAGLEQNSLAQAVAAVALRQRQQAEEFFEEHIDPST